VLRSYFTHQQKIITVVLVIIALSVALSSSRAEKLHNATQNVNYQVVDLSADSTDSSDVIEVSGGIKNFNYTSIRGRAIIYLLDGNQTVLQAVDTSVNDGQSFKHSQVGHFETTVNVSGFTNVQSVTVEFIMDHF